MRLVFIFVLTLFFSVASFDCVYSQSEETTKRSHIRQTSGAWMGAYTTYYFKEHWAYYGEYHVRLKEWMAQMGQIYLRFGVLYKPTRYLGITAGFVNPWYWAPNPNSPNVDKVVPQFRFWEQVVLKHRHPHLKVAHQFRFEQRYSRKYERESPFKWTFRFRYKLSLYVLLNSREMKPNTAYLMLYNEIFFQAGKSITYNYMEDNRAFIGFGYRFNDNFDVVMGYMNTFRYDGTPDTFEDRHIFRVCVFHRLKLYKSKDKKIDPKLYRESF